MPEGTDLELLGGRVASGLRMLLEASGGAGSPVLAEESVSSAMAAELALVEAAETVRAWVDAQQLAALARLHDASVTACRQLALARGADDRPSLVVMEREGELAAVDEVVAATGLGQQRVTALMELAVAAQDSAAEPDETTGPGIGVGLAAMADGGVSSFRVGRIFEATRHLAPSVVAAITARLISAMPDGSVRSHRSFTRLLRALVRSATPDQTQIRREALAARDATAYPRDDGTGMLSIVGDETVVGAVHARLDRIARAVRGAGDPRTLAQLRADVALDLLARGWPTSRQPSGCQQGSASPASTEPPASPIEAALRALGVPEDCPANDDQDLPEEHALRQRREGRNPLGTLDDVGAAPAARVHVVVTLATLLGLDEGIGHVPGWGEVPASVVRAAALAAGSVWQRLVVDDLDGTAVELSTRRYRPTAAMADLVAALHGHCRAPGCEVPATACDLDHQIPWPRGSTSVGNLNLKHRRHHNHKTRGTWTCLDQRSRDAVDARTGRLVWRTLAGRTYTTTHVNWLHTLTPVSLTANTIHQAPAPDPPPY